MRYAAERSAPTSSGNGTYYLRLSLRPPDRTAVVDRFAAANDAWWRLDVDRWHLGVKRYRPGEAHPAHHPSRLRLRHSLAPLPPRGARWVAHAAPYVPA